MNCNRSTWRRVALVFTTFALATAPLPASAQEYMQLNTPAAEYTLGRFKYKAPQTDGWRQMANIQTSLSLVYALQPEPDKIDTVFGVVMEAHDIPPEATVEGAAALAAASANQMAEARKDALVARSPIEAVPGIEHTYTYRLLVHSPVEGQPDGYEIYYVMMAPDKSQYLVIQCIAKNQDYGNQLYFTEFFGSLASLRYEAAGAATKPDAAKPAAEAPKADEPKADAPKADAPKAEVPSAVQKSDAPPAAH